MHMLSKTQKAARDDLHSCDDLCLLLLLLLPLLLLSPAAAAAIAAVHQVGGAVLGGMQVFLAAPFNAGKSFSSSLRHKLKHGAGEACGVESPHDSSTGSPGHGARPVGHAREPASGAPLSASERSRSDFGSSSMRTDEFSLEVRHRPQP